jgi:hypothetical protein
MERGEGIASLVVSVIEKESAAGRLVGLPDILAGLREKGLIAAADMDQESSPEDLIMQVIRENPEFRDAAGPGGPPAYYSLRYMSDAYAGLLAGKAEAPLEQIVRVVRDHSRKYPRPVPAESFAASPFDFPPETISACLAALERDDAYRDIRQTTTSTGTLFLYSSSHLDPDYASMLAEWLDVGRVDNP